MTAELYQQTFQIDSPGRLVVKNIRGSVSLVTGAEGVVKVKAEKILHDGVDDDLLLEIYQQGTTIYALATKRERFRIFGAILPCKVHFTIEAPPSIRLKVKTVSASVNADGFSGDIEINTISGRQEISNLAGVLDLGSTSGAISGRILAGRAAISNVSGKIQVAESNFTSLHAKTISGKLQIQSGIGEGPYDFSSVSGSITLAVPEDANFNLFASGVSGEFISDLVVHGSGIGSRSWQATGGQGGTPVKMKTVSGRMSLVS